METVNTYKNEAIGIATRFCNEFFKLEEEVESAKSMFNTYGTVFNHKDIDAVKKARQVREAKDEAILALDTFKSNLEYNMMQEINAIKEKMLAAVTSAFSANPESLDTSVLELLKSGILEPSEYDTFMEKAKAEKNGTMARMIAKYAVDAGERIKNTDTAKAMRYLAVASKGNLAEEPLQRVNDFVAILGKIARSPSLMKSNEIKNILDKVSF